MWFVMIRIEFIFSCFKFIPLGASGEVFRNQSKEEKSFFTLGGLVSCDANITSSELPLVDASYSKLSLSIYYAKTSNCRHLYSITVVLPPSASITITDWPLRLSQTSKPSLEGWEPGTPLLQSHGNDRVGTIAGLKNYQNSTCNFEGQTLTIWLHLWTTVKLGVKTFFRTLRNFASQTSLKLYSCIDINTVFIDCRSQWDQSVSLLICTLRSDFEGVRKVVLANSETQKKIPSLQNQFSAALKITSKGAD